MTRTGLLAPTGSTARAAVPIRPSDLLAAQMPRHPLAAIPIRPRPDSIPVRAGVASIPVTRNEREILELEALDYSTELL